MNAQAPDAYLVQGFFFQQRSAFGIQYRGIVGAVAVIREKMVRDMFAGVIWLDKDLDMWLGSMNDAMGTSTLEDVEVGGPVVRFDKYYDSGSGGCIRYEFTQQDGGLWVGGFSGEQVGNGSANCVLTALPKGMLEPVQP